MKNRNIVDLEMAILFSESEVVKRLITGVKSKKRLNELFILAVRCNCNEIIKFLFNYYNCEENNIKALKYAVFNHNIEIVKLLLPISNTKIDINSLFWAAAKGYLDIVKLLVTYPYCKVDYGLALMEASRYAHLEVIELLIPHSEIEIIIENLKGEYERSYNENIKRTLEFINDYLLNKKINEELKEIIEEKTTTKKRRM